MNPQFLQWLQIEGLTGKIPHDIEVLLSEKWSALDKHVNDKVELQIIFAGIFKAGLITAGHYIDPKLVKHLR